MSCTCLLRPMRSATTPLRSLRTFTTSTRSAAPSPAAASPKSAPVSSCPAGTRITGLNFVKDAPEIIAKEDSEYPAWLWQILEPKKAPATEAGKLVDQQRRMKKEGRAAIKAANTLKG